MCADYSWNSYGFPLLFSPNVGGGPSGNFSIMMNRPVCLFPFQTFLTKIFPPQSLRGYRILLKSFASLYFSPKAVWECQWRGWSKAVADSSLTSTALKSLNSPESVSVNHQLFLKSSPLSHQNSFSSSPLDMTSVVETNSDWRASQADALRASSFSWHLIKLSSFLFFLRFVL